MENEQNKKLTYEEALRRFNVAKNRKKVYFASIQEDLKKAYKERTGDDVVYSETW
ncbi:MAG: hypothetical protein LIP03_04965 [Bacteroidales bacterium]|nr:hypothetical protein [Bacteroidales bacterium]